MKRMTMMRTILQFKTMRGQQIGNIFYYIAGGQVYKLKAPHKRIKNCSSKAITKWVL